MTTKEKILKSGLKLFAQQGIDKTSTAQITKAAGCAEGTLFVHFPTKQALIDALYLDIKHKAFADLVKSIDMTRSAEENVTMISQEIIEYFLKNYAEFIFMELVEIDPQVSQEALAKGRTAYRGLPEAFKKWIQAGAFKKIEPELLQKVIWSTLMVIIRHCKAIKKKKVNPVYLEIVWDAVKK